MGNETSPNRLLLLMICYLSASPSRRIFKRLRHRKTETIVERNIAFKTFFLCSIEISKSKSRKRLKIKSPRRVFLIVSRQLTLKLKKKPEGSRWALPQKRRRKFWKLYRRKCLIIASPVSSFCELFHHLPIHRNCCVVAVFFFGVV